jgi:Fic family protein
MEVGYLVEQVWKSGVGGIDLPRRDRAAGRFQAYVPNRLHGTPFFFSGLTTADVSDAERAIAELDQRAKALTNTEILARLLLRAEAVASSHIEGLKLPPRRLIQAENDRAQGLPVTDVTATEILGNIDAMSYAVAHTGPITIDTLLDIHHRLLERTPQASHAGRIRNEQNWIGGSAYNPLSARFVPPPAENVEDLLRDLCDFCNEDALPPIAQAAIAHAQFETIHPFTDGNGRTGRALIPMVLRRRGLGVTAMPPISLVLATRSEEYINSLTATRALGDVNDAVLRDGIDSWVAFFAACTKRACIDALVFEQRISELVNEYRELLGPVRSDSSALALLNVLPEMPRLTVGAAAACIGRSFPATNDAITTLVERGILRPVYQQDRNREFEAVGIVDAFTLLERRLASPTGDTITAPPARSVPGRPKKARRR